MLLMKQARMLSAEENRNLKVPFLSKFECREWKEESRRRREMRVKREKEK